MVRLLSRSKSTRELRAKNEVPISDERSFSSLPKESTRRRAATLISPPDYMLQEAVGPSSSLPPDGINAGRKPETSYDIYMDSFLPRNSRIFTGSTAAIGIAIGSPTEDKSMLKNLACATPEAAGHFVSRASFRLPPEPFNIGELGEKQVNMHESQQSKRVGWRKLFGRGLFGSKKGPLAPPKAAPAQQKHNHTATAVAAGAQECGYESTAGQTFSINKLSKGFTQECDAIVYTRETSPTSPHLLNVQIPIVEMERYSVMFQALMPEDAPQEPTPGQKITLYHRRIMKSTSSESISKKPSELVIEPLKRHATTGGRSTPISNVPDSPHSSIPPHTKPNNAPMKVRAGRSYTTTVLTRDPRPGPGFVLAGRTPDTESIPSALPEDQTYFAGVYPSPVHPLTAGDSATSKTSSVSTSSTSSESFIEDDECWIRKVSGCMSSSITGHIIGSIGCEEDSTIGTSPTYSNSSTINSKSSLLHNIPRTEEEVMSAAQQSIQRQIWLSQRQLLLPVVRERAKPPRLQTSPKLIGETSLADRKGFEMAY